MTRSVRLDELRPLWLVLGLGLLMRALVPAGWMPAVDAQGIRLVLCDGWQDVTPETSHGGGHSVSADGHQMSASHVGGHEQGDKSKKADHSAPCTFAASALNVPLPSQVALPTAMPVLDLVSAAFSLVRVGQGLAAPPPPSTGPPSIS